MLCQNLDDVSLIAVHLGFFKTAYIAGMLL